MAESLPNLGRAILNLTMLILAGLSGSWWVLYYTDYFPVVLGLLGLGGFFAWIAFLINILSDERRAQIQQRFDELVLQRMWFLVVVLLAVFFGWLYFAPGFGTLIVDNLKPVDGHIVEVHKMNQQQSGPGKMINRIALSPNTRAKILLPTPWFGESSYYIKVSGLPARRVNIVATQRTTLLVPDMLFERPVILIRPVAKYSGLHPDDYSLQVFINGKKVAALKNYKGATVWFAAQNDVIFPEHLVNQWRQEFISARLDVEGLSVWTMPQSLAPFMELPAGAEISARLILRSQFEQENPEVKFSGQILIPESGKARHFPEQLLLN